MNINTVLGLLIPFLGTALGSAMVFFMKKEMKPGLLSFAAGAMIYVVVEAAYPRNVRGAAFKFRSNCLYGGLRRHDDAGYNAGIIGDA